MCVGVHVCGPAGGREDCRPPGEAGRESRFILADGEPLRFFQEGASGRRTRRLEMSYDGHEEEGQQGRSRKAGDLSEARREGLWGQVVLLWLLLSGSWPFTHVFL